MTDLSSRAMADVVVDAAGDKKAEDILVLNVSELTTIADLFVICTGRGERQVQAIADAVREKAIEAELVERRVGDREMPNVDRVERPAEHADARHSSSPPSLHSISSPPIRTVSPSLAPSARSSRSMPVRISCRWK